MDYRGIQPIKQYKNLGNPKNFLAMVDTLQVLENSNCSKPRKTKIQVFMRFIG